MCVRGNSIVTNDWNTLLQLLAVSPMVIRGGGSPTTVIQSDSSLQYTCLFANKSGAVCVVCNIYFSCVCLFVERWDFLKRKFGVRLGRLVWGEHTRTHNARCCEVCPGLTDMVQSGEEPQKPALPKTFAFSKFLKCAHAFPM